MWQSPVEIIPLRISTALTRCSAVLPLRAGLTRAAKMHECLRSLHSAYESRPGSTALQRFECDNAVEIRDRIMLDFYPGLPHICRGVGNFEKWGGEGPLVRSGNTF